MNKFLDKNIFYDNLKKNGFILNGWLSIPYSFTAEAMSKLGWDSVTIDLQHGQSDYSSSISMLQAMSESNIMPFVRVPWNEPGIIMKILDLGAIGIICPMINNKEDCEKFVSYCYYSPLGQRSFGPMRALVKYGNDYPKYANNQIITLAMIETEEAINNIDEILSVKNLDGIYIGPADMSISYGLEPKFDVKTDPIYSNIKMIISKVNKYNKIAGIHNGTTKYAKEMLSLGYKFVTVSSDYRSMISFAQNIVKDMKGLENDNSEDKKTY